MPVKSASRAPASPETIAAQRKLMAQLQREARLAGLTREPKPVDIMDYVFEERNNINPPQRNQTIDTYNSMSNRMRRPYSWIS